MTVKILIVGNDKISNRALQSLANIQNLQVFIDRSTNIHRLIKLIRRDLISLSLICKMGFCEVFRPGNKPKSTKFASIKNNIDLAKLIQDIQPDEVILFRAGLIINKYVLGQGVSILNLHCARLEGYGGIGSIARALSDKAFDQQATLHVVTEKIDSGKIVQSMPYTLDPSACYCENENRAYSTGIQLLVDYLLKTKSKLD